MIRRHSIAILTLLLCGCGPSAEERANLTAQSLTEQGRKFFSAGLIDEAEDCAEKALATPGATDTADAKALMKEIAELRYTRAWKKGEKELEPAFEMAFGHLDDGKHDEALRLIESEADAATGAKADCARRFLGTLKSAVNTGRAHGLWEPFDLAELEEFAKNGTFPKITWQEEWGPPLEDPRFLAAWRKTLAAALPEQIEQKREEAAHAVPQSPPGALDTNLSVPMEEVNANPEKWYGKRIYFNNAWIRGGIKRDPEHGYTVSVISPNDTPFPAKVTGEKLVFVVSRSAAEQLNALVQADSKIEVKLYAEIERGRVMVLEGQRTFPRASVYWIGILSGGKVRKVIRQR